MNRLVAPVALFVLVSTAVAFGDSRLTLRQAIAEALSSSPRLRASDDGRALAGIRERQASARFGIKATPSFNTSSDPAGFDQRALGVVLSKRLPIGTNFQFTANTVQYGSGGSELRDAGYSIGLSQPLLRGFGIATSAELTQARRGTISASRMYADSRQQLVVSVAESYFSVMRARRLVDAAELSLDRAKRLHISSEARAKVGLVTELDVLRADLLASQSDAMLVAQHEALDSALDGLKTLLGRSMDDTLQLADTDPADIDATWSALSPEAASPNDEPDSLQLLIQSALGARLDVIEARDRIADAARTETVARWNLLPPVNLDLSYTQRGLGAGSSPLFGQLYNGWRVGVSSTYALDRSDESANAAAAAVSRRAAEQDAADTARRVTEEVRRAYRAWTRTATLLDIQMKAVALADRQLRLAQIRYEHGVAGNFDVVDAETNVFQVQSGLIDAQIERGLSALRLRRVSGRIDPEAFRP